MGLLLEGERLPKGIQPSTLNHIKVIKQYLLAGKSPKEISYLINISWEGVRQVIHRNAELQEVYKRTLPDRCHSRTFQYSQKLKVVGE